MTWENWGKGAGKWNMDHILPISLFDLTKLDHQQACYHYSNLRPLWENLNGLKHDYLDNGIKVRYLTREEKDQYLKERGFNLS